MGRVAVEPAERPGAFRAAKVRSALAYVPFGLILGCYIGHFVVLTYDIHLGLGTSGFDYGLYDQGLWLLSRFHDPFVTIMGRNLFGDHTSFLVVVLVPFYWVAPGANVLLGSQAVVIGIGAVPVFLYARRRLESIAMATVLAAVFLLHPAVAWTNLEQFHPDAFLSLTVGIALYGALADKRRVLIAGVVLSLLVKEDVFLLTVPLGVWVAFKRDRKLGVLIVVGSISYAAVATLVVMQSLIGKPSLNGWRIPFGGVGGLISTTFTKPGKLIDYLGQDGRPWYVWQMLSPMALIPLVAPDVALIAGGVMASNVISTFVYQHLIKYHYSLIVVPVLAFATVVAVGRLPQRWRWGAVSLVGIAALVTAYLWGPLPFSREPLAYWSPNYAPAAEARQLAKQLPQDAVVSAYHSFVPFVDHRERIYMFPTPFKAAYWGTYDREGKTLSFVHDIEYVFLPAELSPDLEAVWARWKDRYVLDSRMGTAAIYRRSDLPPTAGR